MKLIKSGRESLVHWSCFITEDTLYVQPKKYLNVAPLFLVKFFQDLNIEMHHFGINVLYPPFPQIE